MALTPTFNKRQFSQGFIPTINLIIFYSLDAVVSALHSQLPFPAAVAINSMLAV